MSRQPVISCRVSVRVTGNGNGPFRGHRTHGKRPRGTCRHLEGAHAITCVKQTAKRRGIDNAKDRPALFNQRDINGEGTLPVRAQKFLRAIKRVNQKEAVWRADRMACGIFLGNDGDARSSTGKDGQQNILGCLIGGGDGSAISFAVCHNAICVNAHDHRPGLVNSRQQPLNKAGMV